MKTPCETNNIETLSSNEGTQYGTFERWGFLFRQMPILKSLTSLTYKVLLLPLKWKTHFWFQEI